MAIDTRSDRELVHDALPWALDALVAADPDGELSDLLAAQVCFTALKRAAGRWEATRGSWRQWAHNAMVADLRRILASDQRQHTVEVLADAMFGGQR